MGSLQTKGNQKALPGMNDLEGLALLNYLDLSRQLVRLERA